MANKILVNKSGIACPVYDRPGWANLEKLTRIGTIYDREVYGYDEGWGGDGVFNAIVFRNSNGKLAYGFLDPSVVEKNWKVMTPITDYPYGTVTINGETFYTFKFRRKENVYRADGSYWGAVASGMRIACRSALAGASNIHWKGVNYVERSTDRAWIKVTGAGYDYGFVNIGLEDGSMSTNISMYGTW